MDPYHGVAAGDRELGYFVQHLLHLWNNKLPGQDCLEATDTRGCSDVLKRKDVPIGRYLQEPEGSGLARLVVDVLLGVSQQHLQLGLGNLVALDILDKYGDGLGVKSRGLGQAQGVQT